MAFLLEPYPEDVTNRIVHDYGPHEREQVAAILDGVRDTGTHVAWIQLAALRAAQGNVHLLQQWVDQGNTDTRDLQLAIESIAGPDWERHYILYGARKH